MKQFMDKEFVLSNATAQKLFHDYAEKMPIIDYHCHVDAREIAENKVFKNIAEAWLAGDHYKWRAMRIFGIDEKYITGDASDYEKFKAFAEVMPKLIGSPLYHWAHLELNKYFGISTPLTPKTCDEIWNKTGEILKTIPVKKIIDMSNVAVICTTNDPTEDLKYHKIIKEDKAFKTKVYPAFRPDKSVAIDKAGFKEYIASLAECCNIQINTLTDLQKALSMRIAFFNENGCRACDHGLDYVPFKQVSPSEADSAFKKALMGKELNCDEIDGYKTVLLQYLANEYYKLGWVMELHFGVLRNTNKNMFETLGADAGFDTAGHNNDSAALAKLIDSFDKNGTLPKTVLFPINPADNITAGTLCGAFCKQGTKGYVQQGAAWWFNDTKQGMENQLKSFADLSVLGCFIGMLTDSRSFLSYTRHEYFRRILCNFIGTLVENGEYPSDIEELGKIVSDISFLNAQNFFNLEK